MNIYVYCTFVTQSMVCFLWFFCFGWLTSFFTQEPTSDHIFPNFFHYNTLILNPFFPIRKTSAIICTALHAEWEWSHELVFFPQKKIDNKKCSCLSVGEASAARTESERRFSLFSKKILRYFRRVGSSLGIAKQFVNLKIIRKVYFVYNNYKKIFV